MLSGFVTVTLVDRISKQVLRLAENTLSDAVEVDEQARLRPLGFSKVIKKTKTKKHVICEKSAIVIIKPWS